MIVILTRQFSKKAPKLSPKIKRALAERIELFMENPFSVILNNHALHGVLKKYRSIDITGDYRLIFEQYDADTVLLIDIDTHHNLYGS